MYQHLALVKTAKNHPKVTEGEIPCVSDMDIILSQALLMDAGSLTFKAIKSGEMADILAGVVILAYNALQALVMRNDDIVENPGQNQKEFKMIAIMRLLSEKVHHCSSGSAAAYSGLYYLCSHLATDFLNADFDKAFHVYHDWLTAFGHSSSETGNKPKCPDLTDCLYE